MFLYEKTALNLPFLLKTNQIKCDNEEFLLKNISHIKLFDFVVPVNNKYNSVKISFGPEHLFRFKISNEPLDVNKNTLEVIDCAVYYKNNVEYSIQVDFENKYFMLPKYVYKIILFSIIMVVLQGILYYKWLYIYL